MRRDEDSYFIPGADDVDGDGVDGDAAHPPQFEAFRPGGAGAPWLRSGMAPWHMWGNSQRIDAVVQDSSAAQRTNSPGQLVKISYKRPETWHWLFAAKLVTGPASPIVATQIEVAFDLAVGIGRSSIVLQSAGVVQDKPFEQFFFQWGPVATLFPRNAQLYSTQVLGPNRVFRTDAPFPNQEGFPTPGAFVTGPSLINEIVAQDLQLSCRVIALAPPGAASLGSIVTVEVSAQFAPKTHVRADWFQQAPDEVVFAGSEVGGS